MKTISEQLGVTDFPFIIKDKQGNILYYEDSNGDWTKYEFDSKGRELYYEDSYGLWVKYEYDSVGNRIYYEDSSGVIKDNRLKAEIITLNGKKYKRIDD